MDEITTLFWDVGGVVLTNGWDRASRRRATETFELDWDDFEERHELVMPAFETGQLKLEEYLERTVFYRPRPFAQDDFKGFMFGQSQPRPDTLRIVERLAGTGKYLMATLNNESLELNLYRIRRFRLREHFTSFFSSCFLGVRKPDRAIYRLALQITQRDPEACLFIDDRAVNLECAQRLGLRTLHFEDSAQLLGELERAGVELRPR